jgi:predicted outer membrane repeat protein
MSGNSAVNGGAISSRSSLRLVNTTVSGNSASTQGGGIFSDFVSPFNAFTVLQNVTISNNSAPPGGGGGIFNSAPADAYNSIVIVHAPDVNRAG